MTSLYWIGAQDDLEPTSGAQHTRLLTSTSTTEDDSTDAQTTLFRSNRTSQMHSACHKGSLLDINVNTIRGDIMGSWNTKYIDRLRGDEPMTWFKLRHWLDPDLFWRGESAGWRLGRAPGGSGDLTWHHFYRDLVKTSPSQNAPWSKRTWAGQNAPGMLVKTHPVRDTRRGMGMCIYHDMFKRLYISYIIRNY